MIDDQLIQAALVEAITQSFFTQKTFFDPNSNYSVQYGGDAIKVVKMIMEDTDFQTVIKRVARNVNKHFNAKELQKAIEPLIMSGLKEAVEKNFRSDNFEINRAIRDSRDSKISSIVLKMMKSDKIQNLIKKKVDDKIESDDYDLDIKISVMVTPKSS